jgi:hypothetical protein
VRYINGLTEHESKNLLDWFVDLVYKNHDLQVRFKWKNPNDIGTEFNYHLIKSTANTQDSHLGQQECLPHRNIRL